MKNKEGTIEVYRLIAKLSKRDIIKLSRMTCKKHYHSYLVHPQCAFNDGILITTNNGKTIQLKEKIGFVDIETAGLQADFHYIFSYCIKELDGKMYKRVLTPKEVRNRKIRDKLLMKQFCKDVEQFTRVVTYYGCLTPEHKVLTADLIWKPAGDVSSKDELLSFEEDRKFNQVRNFKKTKVIHNFPYKEKVYEIKLDDGTELLATGNHPWLVQRNGLWDWRKTINLIHFNGNNTMQRILPLWSAEKDYYAGYLSAFLDGEGCINQHLKNRNYEKDWMFGISFSQKSPQIIEKLIQALKKHNFKYSIKSYDRNHPYMKKISILGGKGEILRFLGITQSAKSKKIELNNIGQVQKFREYKIKSVRYIGKKIVMGLGTKSGTYIAEGFGCHNSRFDLPFLRTRAIFWELDFPIYKSIYATDVYYIIKNKFRLHRNRMETACRTFGIPCKTHPINPEIWQDAMTGDRKALQYILEHNVEDVISLELLWKKVNQYALENKRSI